MSTLFLIQDNAISHESPSWSDRWRHFKSMPHHSMFMLGSIQAVLVMVWWLIDIGGRYAGWYAPVQWAVPAPWAHLYLMLYGLFLPYMLGFLMTTYPKWMAGIPVPEKHFMPAAALLGTGILLGYVGLWLGKPFLLAALAIYLIGWGAGLYALLNVYVGAQRPDTMHALVTSGMLIIGFCLMLVYVAGITLDSAFLIDISRSGGIWWFLFPVFIAVSHRLIPFFSSVVVPDYVVVRPDWALWVLSGGSLVHGVLELSNAHQWLWLVDLPMAMVAGWLSWKWQLPKTLHVPILAMLHIAFAWIGVALMLFSLQSLAHLSGSVISLGRAPLHALMVGYFASMLVAMSTRVTLGHSGRPLVADKQAWAIFLLVQLSALMRVSGEIPLVSSAAGLFYMAAIGLWLVAFVGWLLKFTPVYWIRN